MTWDYGSISSVTRDTIFGNKIVNAAVDSGKYDLVDDVVVPSGNYYYADERFRVLQNSTAGFSVIIRHSNSGSVGTIYFYLVEDYNASTHTWSKSVYASSSGFMNSDYLACNTSGSVPYTLTPFSGSLIGIPYPQAGYYGIGNGLGSAITLNTNSTGFTYAISATVDRIALATYVGQTVYGIRYIGRFDPFLNNVVGAGTGGLTSDPGPYVMISGALTGTSTTYFTRSPQPNRIYSGSNQVTADFTGITSSSSDTSGTPGGYNSIVNGIMVSRPWVYLSQAPYPRRGLLYNVVNFTGSGNYAFGDELNVNGVPKYKVITQDCAIEMI